MEEDVPGRYGCGPKSICMFLRFVKMKPGRQKNQFFFFNGSLLIYDNRPPGEVQDRDV